MKNTMSLQEIQREIGHAMTSIETQLIYTEYDKKTKPYVKKINKALHQLWLYELAIIKANDLKNNRERR